MLRELSSTSTGHITVNQSLWHPCTYFKGSLFLKEWGGLEIHLSCIYNAMKLLWTQKGSLWTQLHAYKEQTGASQLKNNQRIPLPGERVAERQWKTWAACLSFPRKFPCAWTSLLHFTLLFFLVTNKKNGFGIPDSQVSEGQIVLQSV